MIIRIGILAALFAAASTPALAYVDPGILGALYQSLYALIFGGLALWVARPWQYMKSMYQRITGQEAPISDQDENSSAENKEIEHGR